MTHTNWARTLDVCLTAPAFLSKWTVEHMEQKKKGVVVNICSIMTDRTGGTAAAYVASKGALLSLTYEMAALYGRKGIRVVAVSPGNVETQLSQEFVDESGTNISDHLIGHYEDLTPLGRSAQADEIAAAVSWICSDEASYVSGTNIVIDGGFSKNFSNYRFKRLQFPRSVLKGVFTYRSLLSGMESLPRFFLGEGQTPLIRSRYIGPEMGMKNLFFKLESLNPTGSYKDRFASMAIGGLCRDGSNICLATSSGNTGSALAAYAAAAKMSCHVALVDGTPEGKLKQIASLWSSLVDG